LYGVFPARIRYLPPLPAPDFRLKRWPSRGADVPWVVDAGGGPKRRLNTMRVVRFTLVAACLTPAVSSSAADPLLEPEPLPPIGTSLGVSDVLLNPRAIPFPGGWALALEGAEPEWYTAALSSQVLAAAGSP